MSPLLISFSCLFAIAGILFYFIFSQPYICVVTYLLCAVLSIFDWKNFLFRPVIFKNRNIYETSSDSAGNHSLASEYLFPVTKYLYMVNFLLDVSFADNFFIYSWLPVSVQLQDLYYVENQYSDQQSLLIALSISRRLKSIWCAFSRSRASTSPRRVSLLPSSMSS